MKCREQVNAVHHVETVGQEIQTNDSESNSGHGNNQENNTKRHGISHNNVKEDNSKNNSESGTSGSDAGNPGQTADAVAGGNNVDNTGYDDNGDAVINADLSDDEYEDDVGNVGADTNEGSWSCFACCCGACMKLFMSGTFVKVLSFVGNCWH